MKSNLVRQSNIEALRIISMFLVLLYHSIFLKNGLPSHSEVLVHPAESFIDLSFFAASAVCVNVFVLISGWFGIHCKKQSLFSFLFQVLFYFLLGNGFGLLTGTLPSNGGTWLNILTLSTEYWFVYAYLGLYLFAPILNAYLEKASPNAIRNTLICFYLLQTWYGWFRPQEAPFFYGGHSTISFVGLYLLARYLRMYPQCPKTRSGSFFLGFIVISLLTATLGFGGLYSNLGANYVPTLFQYISPLVLLSSVFLFLGFTRLSLRPLPAVNRIALSAFSVYLIHTHDACYIYMEQYLHQLRDLGFSYPVYFLLLLLFLIVVYGICTLIDQIRIWLWKRLQHLVLPTDSPHQQQQ